MYIGKLKINVVTEIKKYIIIKYILNLNRELPFKVFHLKFTLKQV